MPNTLRQMNYILEVAKKLFDRYGQDYYEAINYAETIHLSGDLDTDAARINAMMEGEV